MTKYISVLITEKIPPIYYPINHFLSLQKAGFILPLKHRRNGIEQTRYFLQRRKQNV